MAIYLTEGGGDETRVEAIEDKLKSTIPDLKRVSRVEDIDQRSVNGAGPLNRPPGRRAPSPCQRR